MVITGTQTIAMTLVHINLMEKGKGKPENTFIFPIPDSFRGNIVKNTPKYVFEIKAN